MRVTLESIGSMSLLAVRAVAQHEVQLEPDIQTICQSTPAKPFQHSQDRDLGANASPSYWSKVNKYFCAQYLAHMAAYAAITACTYMPLLFTCVSG